MPDFGIFRGFNEKLFGDKLYAGQLPINLGLIGSGDVGLKLLDLYPSASAAYSLRKLRTEYIGSAIEVRRTNNDVADIGFTSTGELDTAALLAFTGTGALDNGFITTWYDQSGNGRNATQTTAANQPQIVSSGSVITENGKPALDFDGSNSWMNASSVNISAPTTYFTVTKRDVTSGGKRNLFDGIISRQENCISSFALPLRYTIGNGTTNLFGSITPPSTNQELQVSTFDGSSSGLYVNGFSEISGTITSSSVTNLGIGRDTDASDLLDGKYQELILYPSNQSLNRSGIQDNLNDFYSIY
jgi:hypothetical protein